MQIEHIIKPNQAKHYIGVAILYILLYEIHLTRLIIIFYRLTLQSLLSKHYTIYPRQRI